MYSFSHLFSNYGSQLDKFYRCTSDRYLLVSEFHNALIEGISSVAQNRYPNPSSEYSIGGKELEELGYMLCEAYSSFEFEQTSNSALHRFKESSHSYAGDSDDRRKANLIHKE